MRICAAMIVLACLATGCAQLPRGHKAVSLSFRGDPVNHSAEEAIDQIEIIVPSASVHRIGKMPTEDWCAGVPRRQDGSARCTLTCQHEYFAESDIHVFDGVVTFIVLENDERPKASVRIWITRGPLGPGRTIALGTNDFVLK